MQNTAEKYDVFLNNLKNNINNRNNPNNLSKDSSNSNNSPYKIRSISTSLKYNSVNYGNNKNNMNMNMNFDLFKD